MTLLTSRMAYRLLFLQVVLLLVGTQMPGAWRVGLEGSLSSTWGLSSWAHIVIFASMAWVTAKPLAWPRPRIILAALALALLTEGLQFFAIDRHPRFMDVGIDMAGTLAIVAHGR